MTHLNEEQLVDALFEQEQPDIVTAHLARCEECRDRLERLTLGHRAVRSVAPVVPQIDMPKISYRRFARHRLFSRLSWVAAAALVLASLVGFKVEVSEDSFSLQFSILHLFQSQETQSAEPLPEQLAALETRLLEAIQLNAAMTQAQMDQRLNAFYMERDAEMNSFSKKLNNAMTGMELTSAQYAALVREEIRSDLRKARLNGGR